MAQKLRAKSKRRPKRIAIALQLFDALKKPSESSPSKRTESGIGRCRSQRSSRIGDEHVSPRSQMLNGVKIGPLPLVKNGRNPPFSVRCSRWLLPHRFEQLPEASDDRRSKSCPYARAEHVSMW